MDRNDPPEWAAAAVAGCQNTGTWPVLAGPAGCRDLMLSSPVILYDHPEIAAESPGDLFDATEIDEILTLRTLALTEAEKREARATDDRVAQLFDRLDDLPPEMLERMHGAIRYLRSAPAGATRSPAGAGSGGTGSRPSFQASHNGAQGATGPAASGGVATGPGQLGGDWPGPTWTDPDTVPGGQPDTPWWDPGSDSSVAPETDHVVVAGVRVAQGSRVVMRPGTRRADAQDLFLIGREAVVQAVLHDVDGHVHLAVTPVDDPAADLQRNHGRFLYFAPDEVEPVPAEPSTTEGEDR